MTKQELAALICYELSPEEWGEMASILFDEVENGYTPNDVKIIFDQLTIAGVDVTGICKKKHPRPTA
jgi:hypothetical protein